MELLSARRIDIVPKILYAAHCKQAGKSSGWLRTGRCWARDLYINAGAAMGSLTEPCSYDNRFSGDACLKKVGAEEFVRAFDNLLFSVSIHGVTRAISVIRLDYVGNMLNGAHRVSAAIAMNIERVPVQPTKLGEGGDDALDQTGLLDNLWKAKRKLDISTLMMELGRRLQHPKATRDLYVGFIWPLAYAAGFSAEVRPILREKYYFFIEGWEIQLKPSTCHMLVQQVYWDNDWIHKYGALKAVRACGDMNVDNSPVPGSLFFFEAPRGMVNDVTDVKRMIRAKSPLDQNAIHFADPHEVVVNIANFLHPPTTAFLEVAPISRVNSVRLPLPEVLKTLPPGLQAHCVLDNAATLHVHALREATTLELICDEHVKIKEQEGKLALHSKEPYLSYHGVEDPADLVHDPSRYFFLDGWRFIAPEQLVHFLRSRHRALCEAGKPCALDDELGDVSALERLYDRKFEEADISGAPRA